MNEDLHVGDLHRITATFRDSAGTPANPTTVKVRVRKPSGVTTEHDPVAVTGAHFDSIDGIPTAIDHAAGHYHHEISIDQHGPWEAAFRSTGAVQAAQPIRFHVSRSDALEEVIP